MSGSVQCPQRVKPEVAVSFRDVGPAPNRGDNNQRGQRKFRNLPRLPLGGERLQQSFLNSDLGQLDEITGARPLGKLKNFGNFLASKKLFGRSFLACALVPTKTAISTCS